MHELSIAQSILEAVRDEASRRSLPPVVEVGVRVGQLSGIMGDALRFCFEAIVRDTPEEAMRLVLEEVPVRGACRDCESRFQVEELMFSCPSCGSSSMEVTDGMDMQIVWLETAEPVPSAIPITD